MAERTESINIRPGVAILGLFPSMNYQAWYALGELVDNAIDSFLQRKEDLRALTDDPPHLRILIEIEPNDGGYIRIWDNAGGISTRDYQRAFVTAEPPTDSAGLSQFGVGMKSASCWFAREWRVRSTALGESLVRTVEFDVPKIIKEQREHLDIDEAPELPERHYTEVRLWNLYKVPQSATVAKIKRHLASMYRMFLRSGEVTIEFNGEELEFTEPRVLTTPLYKDPGGAPRLWRKEIDRELPTGEPITGFLALREKGSTSEAGLALFRHKRLIMGSAENTYRPQEIFGRSNSYTYQRLFGELNLNDFEVSHTKDGFIWGDREDLLLEILDEELNDSALPLAQQAEKYRVNKAQPSLGIAAAEAADRTASVLPRAQDLIEVQTDASPAAETPETYGDAARVNKHSLELMIKGDRWIVDIDLTDDPAATEWLKVRDAPKPGRKRELGIRIALSHPFTLRYGGALGEDLEGLIRIAVGLAIAQTTARESGVKMAGTVIRNLNELLGGVLAKE